MWPGLPELWFRGRTTGLPAAICFAAALNGLLIARFIYPQWLEPLLVRSVFWGFVIIWFCAFLRAVRTMPRLLAPRHVAGVTDCYDAARNEYLKGRWFEAEALLAQCLEVDPRDALPMLLLASVYRKTDRLAAAAQTLDALAMLETGDGWWLERDAEERRLQRAIDELKEARAAELKEAERQQETQGTETPSSTASEAELLGEEGPNIQTSSEEYENNSEKIAADLAASMVVDDQKGNQT